MNKKTQSALSGAALAMAMASMAGYAGAAEPMPMTSDSADLVHCYGVNACKGHNDCKTAENACAGHGKCKGTGFVATTAKSCDMVGGKVADDWVGQIANSELVHCYGINACKGHNDCKTAENACAGHGKCKGMGFVATPKKACDNMGGKMMDMGS
ncbi:DUF2282 domain-containing protein [Shewanella salipaludis]|uniref:Lipoprotein n=1 Tax=Shewanella salipaludis TaxID=2723052 RepID=A0A972JNA7_9GAMM|nr:DUF2282 domain-containing protein [Shewanella salipaludis]NMH65976.1 hypothetical protein [Shewanella salipaludis]